MAKKGSLYVACLAASGALLGCGSDAAESPATAMGATGTSTGVGGASAVTDSASSTTTSSVTDTSGSTATVGGVSSTSTGSTTVGGAGGSVGTTDDGGTTTTTSGSTTGLGGATATGGATTTGGGASANGGTGNLTGAGGAGGGTGGVVNNCPDATPLMGGQDYCENIKGSSGNGYGYELWADGGGTGCMTVHGVEATFSAEWNGVEDFLARVGLDFNQTQTHSQIGTFTAEFAETKTDDGGLTYIGIYGWTVNPLREFYIIEDWGEAEKPGGYSSDGTPRDFEGTLTADGETYDVYSKLRENKPAITGDSETFEQYFSIRQTARQCGTISISQHFNEWESMGLPLGNLHEVKLLVEAQFNTGSIAFTTATIVAD